MNDGGEGGIRTLDTLLTYTPLAGERLQPLGHFSVFCCQTHYSRSSSLALPGSALLGALRLALRVAVVPPALLRSLRPLGQPLGHFSVFCCQTHYFHSSQRRREDITPDLICDMTGR